MISGLLEIRRRKKAKKPDFIKQDAHKKKRVSVKWRKPRGMDSKMRQHFRGYRTSISKGWKSPAEVRGLHPSGLMPVRISAPSQLDSMDPKKDGVMLGSTVGKKKRMDIIRKAKEKGLRILNIKDAEAYVKSVQDDLQRRKGKKAKAKETQKPAEKKKEAKEDKLAEKLMTEEDKKEAEKKEMEKVITKKGAL